MSTFGSSHSICDFFAVLLDFLIWELKPRHIAYKQALKDFLSVGGLEETSLSLCGEEKNGLGFR